MRKICFAVLSVLLSYSFAYAEVKYSNYVKAGKTEEVLVGRMLVRVSNDRIGCGTYKLMDPTTREIKGISGISEALNTSLSLEEFEGNTLIISCDFATALSNGKRQELVPTPYVKVLGR